MSEGPAGGQDSRPGQESSASAVGNDVETADTGEAGAVGDPAGHGTYDLYQRGLELLGRGSAAAAAQLLERAAAAEPQSRSVLEALARAQFDARRYEAAAENFRRIVEASPSDDYAQFGLGLALARTGDPGAAAEHLALAAAMQPNLRHYADALRSVRATLRARAQDRAENPENPQRDARDV
jgi:tetratricopeptide (TPR) repeat protein